MIWVHSYRKLTLLRGSLDPWGIDWYRILQGKRRWKLSLQDTWAFNDTTQKRGGKNPILKLSGGFYRIHLHMFNVKEFDGRFFWNTLICFLDVFGRFVTEFLKVKLHVVVVSSYMSSLCLELNFSPNNLEGTSGNMKIHSMCFAKIAAKNAILLQSFYFVERRIVFF